MKELQPYIPDDEKRNVFRRAMEVFGDYLSYKKHPDLVIKYSREYALIFQEKSYWKGCVENAKEPEELMW